MFGRCGGWEMPFHIGGSGDEGDVVEVEDLIRHQWLVLRRKKLDGRT